MTREFVPSEWIHTYEAWARRRVRPGLDGRRETAEQARLLIAFLAVWAIAFTIVMSHKDVTARPDLPQPRTGSIAGAAAADDASTSGQGW